MLNLSANDGICNIGTIASRTADVNILTGSPLCSGDLNVATGSGYAGDIRIANLTSVPNTVSIGSVSTTNTLIGANLNLNTSGNGNTKINSTAAQTGTVAIGNTSTTTNTILGASIAIGNSGTNAITIGNASTTTNTILGTTINVGNSGANTINIGNASTTLINVNKTMLIDGGIRMTNTNITSTPWKVCYGRITSTPAVNAGAVVGSQFVNIPGVNFSAVPIVILSVNKTSFGASGAFLYVALDATPLASSPASFYWAIRNGSGTNAGANSYIVSWMAIGAI
jgi:hypothetical protein